VSGPVHLNLSNPGVKIHKVVTAEEMNHSASALFPEMDIVVFAAAVADYKPATESPSKIKRTRDEMKLTLTPTGDIAGKLGRQRTSGQILVGFALETENAENNAAKKLIEKNLDFIVLNRLHDNGAGFNVDTNKIIIIDKDNNQKNFELKSKDDVAKDIVDEIYNLMINGSHA
jgi:phosphopantothenoylcysteine decarboxylase/phosphopantothenate--cysteine ligase